MSQYKNETTRIYTGPAMIAKGLVSRLNELGISPIERNDNESSTIQATQNSKISELDLELANTFTDTYYTNLQIGYFNTNNFLNYL